MDQVDDYTNPESQSEQPQQNHDWPTFFLSGDLLIRLMCSDAMVQSDQGERNEDRKCNRPESGFFAHGFPFSQPGIVRQDCRTIGATQPTLTAIAPIQITCSPAMLSSSALLNQLQLARFQVCRCHLRAGQTSVVPVPEHIAGNMIRPRFAQGTFLPQVDVGD